MPHYDYVIVGSGIAGLYIAILAREHGSVLVLTKGSIDECNTRYAQGGIAAPIGEDDSPELHMRDTIAAGAGLVDTHRARILAEDAADRITDLVDFGVPFDTIDGRIALAKEGAHSMARVLHAGGDATGAHIELTLSAAARKGNITVLEDCIATDAVVKDGVAKGVHVLDTRSGDWIDYTCRNLVIATGGAGRLYRYTTNPTVATGDGVALAFRAGVKIMDMEFYQFHPTALRLPGAPTFLISEAVRGEGGILRNVRGERFMKRYSEQGELAPRDVVARAIVSEMKATAADHVLLDVTHFPSRAVAARFPQIYRFYLTQGLDMAKSPIPVAPAAHYMMGGIEVNSCGETSLPGLYAAGEVTCSGVHGANRLASNSLLENLVFGKRLVLRTAGEFNHEEAQPASMEVRRRLPERKPAPRGLPELQLMALQTLMWGNVGILRDAEGLERVSAVLAAWQAKLKPPSDRASYELASLVTVGRLVAESALLRQESRGAHYRTDFPETSSQWEKHIVFEK